MADVRPRALVTGAGGGIGTAVAERLARDGWDLILHASRDEARLVDPAARCRAAGADVACWLRDLGEPDADHGLADVIGDRPVTGFVHAAGITGDGLAARLKSATAEAVLRINVLSAMEIFRGLARGMLPARNGRIVLIGSTVGLAGNAGQAVYGASKGALVGWARSLARELAPRGITVNVVAPGWIETPMTNDILETKRAELAAAIPLGRIGRPEDVAGAVAFLMGKDGAYVTGQTIAVNGGLWML